MHRESKLKEEKRLVLSGTGGIGKTQLAIAYAKSCPDLYRSVFWISATSEAAVKDSFRSIAGLVLNTQDFEQLRDEAIVRRVLLWLSLSKNTSCLLIFDGYDDPHQFQINSYYPSNLHGKIIITTRRLDLVAGTSIKVKPLQNIEDGLAILQTRSKREKVSLGK